ncbi:MAG TPA: hypothetical protein VG821_00205 [Rhizomicrobium sp.]|nr:hypothetical protein [Rhizomicrobium sp.]
MLNLFALFHLNLAFSSIEDESHATVVANCYTPLLDLAEAHGPIGIEATAYTLQAIAACDPGWITRLSALTGTGRIEFVGSGYSQMIGPLVPAAMVAANLRLGNDAYQKMLELKPRIALVNEQAWSGGLVGQYLDAGYEALLVDWDNVANHHPDWDAEYRYRPQRALGADGRTIPILWTNTVAFQKMQRLAHDDIGLDEYLGFVAGQRGGERVLCLYSSDAEVFGFRPGRYRTEEANAGGAEWGRIASAFKSAGQIEGARLVTPSAALAAGIGGNVLRLETAVYPVPVKKQRKYNVTRWAVTGRDDIGVNAACQRIFAALSKANAPDAEWRELCRLWASDFRTHITQKRWEKFCADLTALEQRLNTAPPLPLPPVLGEPVEERYITIETPMVRAKLDRRRGLAIASAGFAPDFTSLVGGIPHGTFDDIALQADWYTGDCVFEAPGEHKVTDLEWAKTRIMRHAGGAVTVAGEIATPLGPILKQMTFRADAPRIDFELEFQWESWGRGALRLGHVTLLPEAFDAGTLSFTTCNGGGPETFALAGQTVEHGAAVSFLVSAGCALGMTEGWLELADRNRRVRVTVDRQTAPLVGLINHRDANGKLFCQLLLSALELDDTRKPAPYREGPRRFSFSVIG